MLRVHGRGRGDEHSGRDGARRGGGGTGDRRDGTVRAHRRGHVPDGRVRGQPGSERQRQEAEVPGLPAGGADSGPDGGSLLARRQLIRDDDVQLA